MNKFLRNNILILMVALLIAGCGGKDVETWPSNTEDDWIKLVGGKGMANVWGVAIDVAGVEEGAETSINAEASLGTSFEETTGKNIVIFGKRIVTLEATGKRMMKLSINGRGYGTISVGSRIAVDQNDNVSVDQEIRKPAK